MIIVVLEYAQPIYNNIYLMYINFQNAFGSIDHVRILAIMGDLGHPKDMVEFIGNICTNSTTFSMHPLWCHPTNPNY
jgi:hypothetical protein